MIVVSAKIKTEESQSNGGPNKKRSNHKQNKKKPTMKHNLKLTHSRYTLSGAQYFTMRHSGRPGGRCNRPKNPEEDRPFYNLTLA